MINPVFGLHVDIDHSTHQTQTTASSYIPSHYSIRSFSQVINFTKIYSRMPKLNTITNIYDLNLWQVCGLRAHTAYTLIVLIFLLINRFYQTSSFLINFSNVFTPLNAYKFEKQYVKLPTANAFCSSTNQNNTLSPVIVTVSGKFPVKSFLSAGWSASLLAKLETSQQRTQIANSLHLC